jgi:hypothetical protein
MIPAQRVIQSFTERAKGDISIMKGIEDYMMD